MNPTLKETILTNVIVSKPKKISHSPKKKEKTSEQVLQEALIKTSIQSQK